MQQIEGQAPIVDTHAPFRGLTFQPLVPTVGFGTLRDVDADAIATAALGPRNILVTDQVPYAIPLVAGLITEAFQTPLSHVNVLSRGRGTPNMALMHAREDARLRPLMGRLVRLEVRGSDFLVEEADAAAAVAFWQSRQPQGPPSVPRLDTTPHSLVALADATLADVPAIGSKAAQLVELGHVLLCGPGVKDVPDTRIPLGAFAIPFAYSVEHFTKSGAAARLALLRQDVAFQADPATRAVGLAAVQAGILAAPVDPALLALVRERIAAQWPKQRVRFRRRDPIRSAKKRPWGGAISERAGCRGFALPVSPCLDDRVRKPRLLVAFTLVPWLWACGGGSGTQAGGQGHTGGALASGGAGAATGGSPGLGGGSGRGGAVGTGGGVATGGLDPAGGTTASGGVTQSGGVANQGGATNSGGTAAGGTRTGGATNTGGARTGGRVGSGGTPMDAAPDAPAADARAEVSARDGGDAAVDGTTISPPAATKTGETRLTSAGLTVVSYGGYLNGESFQQEGVLTFQGYQYAAFWNNRRHVVMARRQLSSGAWSTFEFTDYTNTADDAHNTISLGVCPADGTLHVAFDHHTNDLHYRKSVADFVTAPASATWAANSFSATTSALVAGTTVAQVTYPRFVTEPGGHKLLFAARIGTSGSGDEVLWEYDGASHVWQSLGMLISGIADSINAYLHGLSYTPGGTRLHVAWCWRETSNASTNHDLFYAYSDDHGRTFKNNAGTVIATTGSATINKSSSGAKVWTIGQNRGLINQEHMTVDQAGRVHVLLGHMPDAQVDDTSFESARGKSQYFHYLRATDGMWSRHPMGYPVVLNFRGKLGAARSGNLYAVLPDLRIAAAAPPVFSTWTLLSSGDAGRFFSDPLVDTARLLGEDTLTVIYPVKSSPDILVLDYAVE